MIGALYRAAIGSQAQTTAKTLMCTMAGANEVWLLERAWITQTSGASSVQTGVRVQRATANGTNTALTPEPLNPGDSMSGSTGTNHTAEPTYTATTDIVYEGFNLLSGWVFTPASDDEIPVCAAGTSNGIGMRLDVTIASHNISYGFTIREIG